MTRETNELPGMLQYQSDIKGITSPKVTNEVYILTGLIIGSMHMAQGRKWYVGSGLLRQQAYSKCHSNNCQHP